MDGCDRLAELFKERQRGRVKTFGQMTLGQLISELEKLLPKQEEIKREYGHEAYVVFDFEYLFPIGIDSWRGSYDELALEFACDNSKKNEMELTSFLEMLKETVGAVLTGYKGGEYKMTEDTPVWVSNYGHSANTAVVGVIDNDFEIILETKWMPY